MNHKSWLLLIVCGVSLAAAGCSRPDATDGSASTPPAGASATGGQPVGGAPQTLEVKSGKDRLR